MQDTLRIGPHDWATRWIDLHQESAREAHAACFKNDLIIELPNRRKNTQLAECIVHEGLHAIVHSYGMTMDDDHEEELVNRLAQHICDCVRNNPEWAMFVIYLLQQGNEGDEGDGDID